MEEAGLDFRATKDLDMVLVIEAMDAEFGQHFWQFVQAGRYATRERSSGKPQFYRFQKPAEPNYPAMLELFSRSPDGLVLAADAHLTPIPIDEAVSSLSAILLDADYYAFIMAGANVLNGIACVGTDRLIPLKANAWLDLRERVAKGEPVDARNVRKHLLDVVRLSQLLAPDMRIAVPTRVAADMTQFLALMEQEAVDMKTLGLGQMRLPTVADRIRVAYGLPPAVSSTTLPNA